MKKLLAALTLAVTLFGGVATSTSADTITKNDGGITVNSADPGGGGH